VSEALAHGLFVHRVRRV
jgi:ABC-2 type transport system ATP-binding protein